METPKIYVADLNAYNNGRLVGEWVDLTDYSDADELMDHISELTDQWAKDSGESEVEYAIHDYENFPSNLYSEYMGRKEFETIYELLEASENTGLPYEVIEEWMSNTGNDSPESVEDAFYGSYGSEEDFAYSLVEEGVLIPDDYQVYVSDIDRGVIAGEEESRLRSDLEDEGELSEEEIDERAEEEYDLWYNGLEDPISFLVDEMGIYSREDIKDLPWIQVDYEKIARELGYDYNFIEHDGEVYVFSSHYRKGGSIGFKGLQRKVAKNYRGKKVPRKYQSEYGKRYSQEEAMEVGAKVAAKVAREKGVMREGGQVWTKEEQEKVKKIDVEYYDELRSRGIDFSSKEASDVWKDKYRERFKAIFNKREKGVMRGGGATNKYSDYFDEIRYDSSDKTYTFVTKNDLEYYTDESGEIFDGDGWATPRKRDEEEIIKFFQKQREKGVMREGGELNSQTAKKNGGISEYVVQYFVSGGDQPNIEYFYDLDEAKKRFSNLKNAKTSFGNVVGARLVVVYKNYQTETIDRYKKGGQLERGIKVEREHADTINKLSKGKTPTDTGARMIAKDHLKEDDHYYTHLEEMEDKYARGGEINTKEHNALKSIVELGYYGKSGPLTKKERLDILNSLISKGYLKSNGNPTEKGKSLIKPTYKKGGEIEMLKQELKKLDNINTKEAYENSNEIRNRIAFLEAKALHDLDLPNPKEGEVSGELEALKAVANDPDMPKYLRDEAKEEIRKIEGSKSKPKAFKPKSSAKPSPKKETPAKPSKRHETPKHVALAKEIRKEGESWQAAMRRASAQLKGEVVKEAKKIKRTVKDVKKTVKRTETKAKKTIKRTLKSVEGSDEKRDKKRKAKHAGKRISKNGKTYYEYRENRADSDRRRKLEEGGEA